MGGKGGGGQQYYQEPLDRSGNATLEEAEKTLAAKKPLDMSGYQQSVDVKKAASDATAKPADTVNKATNQQPAEGVSGTETTPDQSTGALAGKAVLQPPGFWTGYGKPGVPLVDPATTTTQV